MSEINDKRVISDFRNITFSNYKKNVAKKELTKTLYESKVEDSCYWSSELICAGHFSDLWDIIIIFTSRFINIGNPKLPIYLDLRFKNFKDILLNGYIDNELSLRNNNKIRNIFCEIICILCNSNKKPIFNTLPNKDFIFNISELSNKLKAPSVEYSSIVFLKNDPNELFIAINELAYHISEHSLNTIDCFFWIDWIIEYDIICKKKKKPILCEKRNFIPVNEKYQNDIIWIIWDLFLKKTSGNKIKNRIIECLLNLFTIRYTSGCKKRRKYLLYNSINVIIENINYNIEINSKKQNVETIINKISIIYKQIKKNEIPPESNYLVDNIEKKSNLNKTLEKLEMMNKVK